MADIHSFGEPNKVRVTTLALDLTASFEARTLAGTAVLGIEQAVPRSPLKLDTRELTIEQAESSADGSIYATAPWQLGQSDAIAACHAKRPGSDRTGHAGC